MDRVTASIGNLGESAGPPLPELIEGHSLDAARVMARFRRRHERRRGKHGTALVELAIVLLLLTMFTFGGMEYGWMFFQMHQINNAARAGVRVGVLPDSDNGAVGTMVEATLGQSPDGLQIEPGDVTESSTGELIRVTVTLNYAPLIGLPFLPTPNELRASVAMAKEGPS